MLLHGSVKFILVADCKRYNLQSYVWPKNLKCFLSCGWVDVNICCLLAWFNLGKVIRLIRYITFFRLVKLSNVDKRFASKHAAVYAYAVQYNCCKCLLLMQMFWDLTRTVSRSKMISWNVTCSDQLDRSVGQFWSFWTVLKHGFLLCAAQRHSERNSCCWSCTKVYYICVYNLELTARRLMMTL